MKIAFEGRLTDLDDDARRRLMDRQLADDGDLTAATRAILERVRAGGDDALLAMAREFDGVELPALEVPRAGWDEALASLDPAVRDGLEHAARNLETFHRAQVPADLEVEVEPGVRLGRRFVALPTVGVYAPGGRASYPSSVLMGVVPARAAGVDEIVVCSPPGPDGLPSAVVRAAAAVAGATRLFAVGGAGAVGAMAFGTASVPRCAALVGPGNRWVLEAKRQVAGKVLIDSPAGPSEVLVVAESPDVADARRVAAELVAQAEHDPDAAVVLVSPSRGLIEAVRGELGHQVGAAPRRELVEAALAARGALLEVDDLAAALAFADAWAPEHLALYTRHPFRDMVRIGSAGTIFLGDDTSVALGDYLTGANHVLPTAGSARSFSGLSTLNFMRSYTWQRADEGAARRLAPVVAALARAEGLPGHALAAELRAAPGRVS
jgi:histidinol dehydrogenase